jgi:hypothetical protein
MAMTAGGGDHLGRLHPPMLPAPDADGIQPSSTGTPTSDPYSVQDPS